MARVDPATNRVVKRIRVGSSPCGVADGTISVLDPATNSVADTVTVGGRPFVVRSAFGSLWVDDYRGTTIKRIQP
jgi:DNA-binding beta-propeller fold protein YncE